MIPVGKAVWKSMCDRLWKKQLESLGYLFSWYKPLAPELTWVISYKHKVEAQCELQVLAESGGTNSAITRYLSLSPSSFWSELTPIFQVDNLKLPHFSPLADIVSAIIIIIIYFWQQALHLLPLWFCHSHSMLINFNVTGILVSFCDNLIRYL